MIDDDENFLVDADGNRFLIGLTLEETLSAISAIFPGDFAHFQSMPTFKPTMD